MRISIGAGRNLSLVDAEDERIAFAELDFWLSTQMLARFSTFGWRCLGSPLGSCAKTRFELEPVRSITETRAQGKPGTLEAASVNVC